MARKLKGRGYEYKSKSKYLVICVNLGSRSRAKNECDKNCAPNQGKANNGGVSLSLCIYLKINCMALYVCVVACVWEERKGKQKFPFKIQNSKCKIINHLLEQVRNRIHIQLPLNTG